MEIMSFAILALIVMIVVLQIQINDLKSENKQLRDWHLNLHEHVNGLFKNQININENVLKALCNLCK